MVKYRYHLGMRMPSSVEVTTRISGIHPRSEEHIRVSRMYDRGTASRHDLELARETDVRSFISHQETLGISMISDGRLGWQDILRNVSESCTGVKIGALTRWFGTNTFFRQPVIESEITLREWSDPIQFPRGKGLAILPGCYTFAMLVKDLHYRRFTDLLYAVGDILTSVTRWYISTGVKHILFAEPSLVVTPPKDEAWSPIADCYRKIRSLGVDDLIIQTFFEDMKRAMPSILEIPATSLGIDFFETEVESVSQYDFGSLRVDCGCIDATNSFIEDATGVAGFARMVATRLNLRKIGISPNAPMEYLPRVVADRKLHVIADASRIAGGD